MLAFIAKSLLPKKLVHVPDGEWVAEAWLVWDICTGSTMYRERFNTKEEAHEAAKKNAAKLDRWTPSHQNFGISYGVRKANKFDNEHSIWSWALPGEPDYSGEYWQAHPLNQRERK